MAHRHKPNNTVFAAACVVGRCAVCALMSSHAAPATRPSWRVTQNHGSARKRTTLTGGLWRQSVEGVERAGGPFGAGWLAGLGRLALSGSARPPSQILGDCEAVSRLHGESKKSWPARPTRKRGGGRRRIRLLLVAVGRWTPARKPARKGFEVEGYATVGRHRKQQ